MDNQIDIKVNVVRKLFYSADSMFVVFAFDYSAYTLLSKQLVYTGISRASKGCVMVCENRALHHAVNTDHGGLRRTFLHQILMGELE